jgi:ferric-dicitrate binding protein FerR (iron transport regulator)
MKNQESHINSDTYLAQWLAGELSDAQLKTLVSQEDFNAYLKLRKGLEINEKLNGPIGESFEKINQRINKKHPKVRSLNTNWLIGVAASIVALFGLFMFLDNDEMLVESGYGMATVHILKDGSEVTLNSKSTIAYTSKQWRENRTLELRGEAYFKVAKGEKFTVNTANGSVTVLGTQFNVNSTDDFFEVICYEGKVSVKTADSEHILLPTQSVRKINGYKSESITSKEFKPTWVDGESTFKSVPLKYVITALEHQYDVVFETKEIDEEVVFSGGFPHGNLNMALTTVFDALSIKYIEKENRNIKLRY